MVTEYRARVSSTGQLTLPSEMRETLGIADGDFVKFVVAEESATMTKEVLTVESVRGLIKTPAHMVGCDLDEMINEAWEDHANEVWERMQRGEE